MNKITDTDILILQAQSADTLARWANLLNTWKWPSELPDPEMPPAGPPHMPNCQRRSALYAWIENRIGPKLISQDWNCRMGPEKRRMTIERHEAWWKENHGDIE